LDVRGKWGASRDFRGATDSTSISSLHGGPTKNFTVFPNPPIFIDDEFAELSLNDWREKMKKLKEMPQKSSQGFSKRENRKKTGFGLKNFKPFRNGIISPPKLCQQLCQNGHRLHYPLSVTCLKLS
jgi:hypothetical protein